MRKSITPEPGNPELAHPHEMLFPFGPEFVVEGLTNLENSSNNMLALLTESRGKHGAADQLYANMPFDDLVDWHVDNHDFDERGALLYKAGLLYGMDLTQQLARQTDQGDDMPLNSASFARAIDYLHGSYSGLDDDEKENWRRQKERELLYTGSDILSLANATLQDKIKARLGELGIDIEPNALAQHAGIVDGAIFVDAYRAFSRDQSPRRFTKPETEFIPTYNPKIHVKDHATDLAVRYEFEHLSELLSQVEYQDNKPEESHPEATGAILSGVNRIIQIGPNDFTTAFEVRGVQAPHYSAKRVGAFALSGAAVDAFYAAFSSLPAKYVPLATGLNLSLGILSERSRRRDLQRKAQSQSLVFTKP